MEGILITIIVTVAVEIIKKKVTELPIKKEVNSFKNEIISELEVIKAHVSEFEEQIDSGKTIDIDEAYKKGTHIIQQLTPVLIKLRVYFEKFSSAKEQADLQIAFNLFKELDSEIQSASNIEQYKKVTQSHAMRSMMTRSDEELIKITKRIVSKVSKKKKSRNEPTKEVFEDFKKAFHSLASA
jgi:hypothetical protein